MTNIRIVWYRTILLKQGETTDKDGYAPLRFEFTSGHTVKVDAKRIDIDEKCCWQRKRFESKCYMTTVELWLGRDQVVYVYSIPDHEILRTLA